MHLTNLTRSIQKIITGNCLLPSLFLSALAIYFHTMLSRTCHIHYTGRKISKGVNSFVWSLLGTFFVITKQWTILPSVCINTTFNFCYVISYDKGSTHASNWKFQLRRLSGWKSNRYLRQGKKRVEVWKVKELVLFSEKCSVDIFPFTLRIESNWFFTRSFHHISD